MASGNHHDIEQGYCANCHKFHEASPAQDVANLIPQQIQVSAEQIAWIQSMLDNPPNDALIKLLKKDDSDDE